MKVQITKLIITTNFAAQSGTQSNGDGHIEYTTGISPTHIHDVHDKNAKNLNVTLTCTKKKHTRILLSIHKKQTSVRRTPQKFEYAGGHEIVHVCIG